MEFCRIIKEQVKKFHDEFHNRYSTSLARIEQDRQAFNGFQEVGNEMINWIANQINSALSSLPQTNQNDPGMTPAPIEPPNNNDMTEKGDDKGTEASASSPVKLVPNQESAFCFEASAPSSHRFSKTSFSPLNPKNFAKAVKNEDRFEVSHHRECSRCLHNFLY